MSLDTDRIEGALGKSSNLQTFNLNEVIWSKHYKIKSQLIFHEISQERRSSNILFLGQ